MNILAACIFMKEYIVVLGLYLNDDGSMRLALRERCVKALALLRDKPNASLILTGGRVNKAAYRTESEAMEEFFLSRGVDKERIILENEANNSFQNTANVNAIIKKEGKGRVYLVSSSSHIYRPYFNPCLFFLIYFHTCVVPTPAFDSNVDVPNGYLAGRENVLVSGKKKAVAFYAVDNKDKNVFAATIGKTMRNGLRLHRYKEKDGEKLRKYLEELYGEKITAVKP